LYHYYKPKGNTILYFNTITMRFCPHCKFMLYTKMIPIQEGSETQDVQLSYYCKHCNWVEEMKLAETSIRSDENEMEDTKTETSKHGESTCIYQRNYKEDFIVDRVISNRYTIYDYTLPRVAYDCINEKCATNREFDESRTVYITNVPADYSDKDIEQMLTRHLGVKMDEIEERQRIQLTNILLVLKDAKMVQNVSKMIDKKVEDEYTLHVESYQKPRKEILYIKYDPINMKYLYICSNCGTSWKKD
jgi:hypothetical protein